MTFVLPQHQRWGDEPTEDLTDREFVHRMWHDRERKDAVPGVDPNDSDDDEVDDIPRFDPPGARW